MEKNLDKPAKTCYNIIVDPLRSTILARGKTAGRQSIRRYNMAKTGEKYEAVVVFSLKNGEDAVKALVAKFSDLIKEHAELVDVDEWGKRKLAYDINYESEGYYVVYRFDSKPEFPDELERVINITDGVLRYIVVLRK